MNEKFEKEKTIHELEYQHNLVYLSIVLGGVFTLLLTTWFSKDLFTLTDQKIKVTQAIIISAFLFMIPIIERFKKIKEEIRNLKSS